ncbi:TRAP transporter small permease [Azospirillum sp. ST 5-10]|uniref:TRAP transporter small permease n=1 Tax=unclassified Azospirillum TaxID=2630922 RepID=UPI003F49BDC0
MTVFIRAVATVSRLCGVVAALLIAVSVLVVSHMVASRYVFGAPTIWQTEFVTYALVAATLIGSPYVALHRGHVNMDIVALHAGRRARFWLALAAAAGALAFCLLLTVQGARLWHEAWAGNWHSETVWRVPLWIPYAALPLGMGILCLQYVADIAGLLTGRALPFDLPHGDGDGRAAPPLHAEAR